MWKVFTGIIADEVYNYIEDMGLFPTEQKGCRRGSRGTKDRLLIDKLIIKNCKRRKTNLSMAWIDYKKAYDMVPHSWILECLKMVGVHEKVFSMLEGGTEKWEVELTAAGQKLGDLSGGQSVTVTACYMSYSSFHHPPQVQSSIQFGKESAYH